MEQRVDLFCVFLTLIFPTLWTRLENWFPSLRRFCLHTKRTKTSQPDVPQSRGTSFPVTESWSQRVEMKDTQKKQDGCLDVLLQADSTPSSFQTLLGGTTPFYSQDFGKVPDFSSPLTGTTYVACPCNWCTAWNQRVRERESGRGGRRSFS